MILEIPMTPPEKPSSQVEATGYNAETETLRIQFRGGSQYDYLKVPQEEADKMLAAESIGKFINAEIKPKYQFLKVEREEVAEG